MLVIGCGNLLRGDDAAGPELVRRMCDRGLPDGVGCADGGTGGMDVAFQMRGVPHVIVVDACSSGSEPGTLFEVSGHEMENLPPLSGINLHAFRWDHAIAFARWLLKDEYPERVTAYLIEGARYEIGEGLSPPVAAAVDHLVDRLLATLGPDPVEPVEIQLPGEPHDWVPGPRVDELTAARPVAFNGGGATILVLRVKGELRAFRNACGHVGLPLERGICDMEAGTITCPWHGYRFDAATGACLSAPQCQLEPFAVRVRDGVIEVKPS